MITMDKSRSTITSYNDYGIQNTYCLDVGRPITTRLHLSFKHESSLKVSGLILKEARYPLKSLHLQMLMPMKPTAILGKGKLRCVDGCACLVAKSDKSR